MDLWIETFKILVLPLVMILWYHYWIWKMSKKIGLPYWTCARSLWEYGNTNDPIAVKKLRWLQNIQKPEDQKDEV